MKNSRHVFVFLALAAVLISVSAATAQEIRDEVEKYTSNLPFEMPAIQLPDFPNKIFNVKDYGAVGDGHSMNTAAIQKSIDSCSSAGGGTVVIPAGLWLTGPIQMKSNVNLHLNRGAVVEFSRNHEDYPIVSVPGRGWVVESPIFGIGLENVAITGSGLVDGNGITWRPVKSNKVSPTLWKELLKFGGVVTQDGSMWWPSQEAENGEQYLKNLRTTKSKDELAARDFLPARDFLRPVLVLFIDCRKVLFDGTTFEDSPSYALYPNWCEDVVVRNVKINNEYWAQNSDAIDISACRNVLVYKCTVTAGDDGICMKSSLRKNVSSPSLKNVVIADCVVYHAHGGFVIGSNTDGGMENISVKNCDYVGTDIGLRFKSSRGRGALVKNVYVDHIYMKDIVDEAILFDTYYEGNAPGEGAPPKNFSPQPVNDRTPIFQNFYIDSVYCDGAKQAIRVAGLPEMPVHDITISDSYIAADKGFESNFASGFTLKNDEILPRKGNVFSLSESKDFVIDKGFCPKTADVFLYVSGKNSSNIRLIGTDISSAKIPVKYGADADTSAVVRQ
ncbi:MAG TPA: glycoside hydrolase family 28 protein [Candidatus Acidoferrales bacterium]|nr:glycoside hydrolase family 28 protein [Candidatus Acidoferrales bacterium]